MTGPIDPTLRKVHVSLNVAELERSIAFCRVLLGAEPAKVRKDYAPAGGRRGVLLLASNEVLDLRFRRDAVEIDVFHEDVDVDDDHDHHALAPRHLGTGTVRTYPP